MKAKPDINQFLVAPSATASAATGDAGQVVMIPTNKMRPNAGQDRGEDHFETDASKEYIASLAASMRLPLADGKTYGVRDAIKVRPQGDDGLHEIIDGENRWRAAASAGLAEVPCLIRSGDDVEARIEHVTSNALRSDLNLWQQANSIRRDTEEFGLSTEQVIIAHGLRNKSQLSKIMAVFKLSEDAQAFVKKGYVQDVNLVYELKKLPEELLPKLAKRVLDKGETFPAALKAVLPKEPKEPKNKQDGGDGDGQQAGQKPAAEHVTLKLKPAAAKALAILLDIEGSDELNPATLAEQLQQRLNSMAEEGEGE